MSGMFSMFKTNFNPRMLWIIAIGFIAVNVSVAFINGFFSSYYTKKQIEEHFYKIAEARSKVFVEPVWVFEYDRVQQLLKELMVDKNIVEAKISVDIDKETFSSSQGLNKSGSTNTVVFPIVFKNKVHEEKLGNFTMTYSTGQASTVFVSRLSESIIISFILLLLVAFLTSGNTTGTHETRSA